MQNLVLLGTILLLLLHISTPLTTVAKNDNDSNALLEFKRSLSDPQGVMRSWNEFTQFCNWEGITCGRRHQRVTVVDLQSNDLSGTLSPHIGNLSFLRVLWLVDNSFQGQIPQEIGKLSRLEILDLSLNYFEGQIPTNLSRCSKLTNLDLHGNRLVGKIPGELVNLKQLFIIHMNENNLTGTIPSWLGNLTNLEELSFAGNQLEGTIPQALGQLKNLNGLYVGDCNLHGTIPPPLFNLSRMIQFSMEENQLQGVLPSDLGHTLPQLRYLQLRNNNFSGPLPTSLSNASNLQILDLRYNSFTGKLMINFELLKKFRILFVGNNYLGSGEPDDLNFIASLTNCTIFMFLSISINQFGGVLPNCIGNLSSHLRRLDMDENQISGDIPKEIGNLISLDTINLYRNRFTGSIPEEMGKLQNLQAVRLFENRLSGRIPYSFGNLSLLNDLFLDSNKLEGNIPSSLGSCQQLATLNLSNNNLSGTIPEEIFGISSLSISLNLARNKIGGALSSKISNLMKLGELDISENELSGEIPSSLGGCTRLENLNLAGNFFQGPIPLTLNDLEGLQSIDLSRNNLSGLIPGFLENFQLKSLNLSFNDLEGEVPTQGAFLDASTTDVAGNYRLCGGVAALNLPKCPSKASKNQKKSSKIIIIISIGSVPLLLMVATFLLCWLKRRGNKESSGDFGGNNFLQVSYATLFKATDGFSSASIIGSGSSGSVYRGIIDQYGTAVAIKVFNLQYRTASRSFAAECEALRNIRHRNLVKIITSCSSTDFQGNDFKALVYKFEPNGNLDRWLHPPLVGGGDGNRELQHLSLLQRINIATDVACALDYLHHHCEKPIVHCDLKPRNILLDKDMTAHVGDFGQAKFLPEMRRENESNSVGVRGTIGYAPPEYGLGSEVATSGDVYSYGVLLLEMVTGKRPTDATSVEGLNLHKFAKKALQEHILEIADPILLNADEHLASDMVEKCLICLTRVGVACSLESPQERMDINNVIEELNFIRSTAFGTLSFLRRRNA